MAINWNNAEKAIKTIEDKKVLDDFLKRIKIYLYFEITNLITVTIKLVEKK